MTKTHVFVGGDLLCERLRDVVFHTDDSCVLFCRRINGKAPLEERQLHMKDADYSVCVIFYSNMPALPDLCKSTRTALFVSSSSSSLMPESGCPPMLAGSGTLL